MNGFLTYIVIDRSYFALGPVEAEIWWSGKSVGFV